MKRIVIEWHIYHKKAVPPWDGQFPLPPKLTFRPTCKEDNGSPAMVSTELRDEFSLSIVSHSCRHVSENGKRLTTSHHRPNNIEIIISTSNHFVKAMLSFKNKYDTKQSLQSFPKYQKEEHDAPSKIFSCYFIILCSQRRCARFSCWIATMRSVK